MDGGAWSQQDVEVIGKRDGVTALLQYTFGTAWPLETQILRVLRMKETVRIRGSYMYGIYNTMYGICGILYGIPVETQLEQAGGRQYID